MAKPSLGITFDDMGIASALARYQLMVPPNQRSYAWEESHVQTLFEDFSAAITKDDPTYFLGTIVLTHGETDRLEVADGQQRLATVSILIAAIRDYLQGEGMPQQKSAMKYTSTYLVEYDEMSGENVPKLKLNTDDASFIVLDILLPPDDPDRKNLEPQRSSHERLKEASKLARAHVEKIIAPLPKADRANTLYKWLRFLRDYAILIVIEVPDHINAYIMFETLNDRGLRASQTDILKNYLFGKADDRLDEMQPRWLSMVSIIESIGDDDLLLQYLRHFWISWHGPTVERELAAKVKDGITSRQQAIDFVNALDTHVTDYTALLTPLNHPRWSDYDHQTQAYIAVITTVLGIEQIRPLLMALVRSFAPSEVKLALKQFISWSVRFLVAGGGGGGVLDKHYGLRAKEVSDGTIQSAKQLAERMKGVIRTDAEFSVAFQSHRVSRIVLARYYLRALEIRERNEPIPELVGVDDPNIVNLEHVMPQTLSDDWHVTPETAQAYYKRIGNMVLLSPNVNVKLGNKGFEEKKHAYLESPYLLTQYVGDCDEWVPAAIEDRQEHLSELALQIWTV